MKVMSKALLAGVIAGLAVLAGATGLTDSSISLNEWLLATNAALAAFQTVYFIPTTANLNDAAAAKKKA